MMELNEVRKEDDIYFQGPFWIIGDSQLLINRGQFTLVGKKIPVDYKGNYLSDVTSKKGATAHIKLWDEYKSQYNNVPYNYYPRGRVRVVSGTPFIHINSKTNNPRIINAVTQMYGLEKIADNISVEEDDLLQGSHYGFLLK